MSSCPPRVRSPSPAGGHLPQDLIVDDVLGVAGIRQAIAAIERGEGDEQLFGVVGEQWDMDRRQRYGKKMLETKREPKVRMRKRAEDAEVAAGKHRGMHVEKLAEARDRLRAAEDAARTDEEIRIDLPETAVPQGKQVLRLSDVEPRPGQVGTSTCPGRNGSR